MKMTIKQIRLAYDALSGVFYAESRNYAQIMLDEARDEEKGHRGFGSDFNQYHTSDTVGVTDAAKLFCVKRVAEYILKPQSMPKGKDYLHTQKSCFTAAGIADEYEVQIRLAWAAYDYKDLAALDYCDYVKVIRDEPKPAIDALTIA